ERGDSPCTPARAVRARARRDRPVAVVRRRTRPQRARRHGRRRNPGPARVGGAIASEPVIDASDNVHVVRAAAGAATKQGLVYGYAVSAESVGARGLCMHLGTIPPGALAEAHLHESHETAIYVLEGSARMRYGAELEHEV